MASLSEPKYPHDVVRWESDPTYNREVVTASGSAIAVGAPLIITGTSATVVAAASEGSANGVAMTAASAAGVEFVALARGPAWIDGDQLAFESGVDEDAIRTALAGLSTPIISRREATISQDGPPTS